MSKPTIYKLIALLCLLVISVESRANVAKTIQRAHALINSSQSQQAVTLLRPYALEYSGQREFDYAYALSLLDSGSYHEALFVFDRLVSNFPQFVGARLDMTRAHIALENYEQALQELDALSAMQPPQKAQQEINRLRGVIASRNRAMRFSRRFYVSTAAGYDTNVNSATVAESFLGFTLDERSKEVDSDFFQIGAGASLAYRWQPNLTLTTRLDVSQRNHAQASFVDSRIYSAQIGLHRQYRQDQQSLRLSIYQLDIDSDFNSRGVKLSGIWMRDFAPAWKIGIRSDASILNYEDALSVKDVRRLEVGVVLQRALGSDAQGAWVFNVGGGIDDPQEDGSRYARHYWFARSSLSWKFSSSVDGLFLMQFQDSQYDEVFFEQRFNEEREDTLYRVRAAIDWQINKYWGLNHSLSYSFNDTFVDIFEYEKLEAIVRLNYEF